MIRDRVVVGIRDSSLSEKLQLDADFTLTTAVVKGHQAEVVRKWHPLLHGETSATSGAKPDTPVGVEHKWGSPEVLLSTHKQIRRKSQSQPPELSTTYIYGGYGGR